MSTAGKRRHFINRRTKPESSTAESTSLDNEVTTETSQTSVDSQLPDKNSFRRRGTSKFEPKEKRQQNGKVQPTESQDDTSHRFGGNSRRSSFKPSASNPREKPTNTEALSASTKSPNARPTRTFVRPRPRRPSPARFTKQSDDTSGKSLGTTTPLPSSTTGSPSSRTTDANRKKQFRVGVRRRNPFSSTVLPESTVQTSAGNDLAGQESVEKAKSGEESRTSQSSTATEGFTTSLTSAQTTKEQIRKTVKIQRRPLTSVKNRLNQVTSEETPTASENSSEKKRDSKKYSASFKQNQLDEMLKNQVSTEKIVSYASTESIEELSSDTDRAVAIAAHQLAGAPLPSTEGEGKGVTPIVSHTSAIPFTLDELEEGLHLTRDYLMESPVTGAFDADFQYLTPVTTTAVARTIHKSRKRVTQAFKRISTTIPPPTRPISVELSPQSRARAVPARRRPVFDKIEPLQVPAGAQLQGRTYRPISDYEYYDDNDDKILDKFLGSSQNVLLNSRGIIECLDIGNFPHPSSCKKFISCVRRERGTIYGWEYTCPSGLSYDPVGGICNWSAGLGCNEN